MKLAAPTLAAEEALQANGYQTVAGVDEVGRGPAAGPMTVAAVILPEKTALDGVRDSKQLTPRQRERACHLICRQAVAAGIGWAKVLEIDRLGLTAALRLAASRALSYLGNANAIILDGSHNYLGDDLVVQVTPKADQTSLSVAAASVLAKVARDRYMQLIDRRWPEYGFAEHKGYLAPRHLKALQKFGPSPLHRRSWKTIRELTG